MVFVIVFIAGLLLGLIGYGHLRQPQKMVNFRTFRDDSVELSADETQFWKRVGIGLAVVGGCVMVGGVLF